MKKIFVLEDTPEKFARKVQLALQKGPLGKVCGFSLDKDQFCISFSQMGTSRIYFHIQKQGSGFVAEKQKEEILLLHQFFREEVQRELKKIIQRFGGMVE